MLRDKIVGSFLGLAIGDALGMPYEGLKKEEINERVTNYTVPTREKLKHRKLGSWTDDTQLMLAVAEGILSGGLDIESQIKSHVAAYQQTTDGWGSGTKNAIRNLINGVSYQESSKGSTKAGNGTVMKILPAAVYCAAVNDESKKIVELLEFTTNLSLMTHRPSVCTAATLAHTNGLVYCLISEKINKPIFCAFVRVGIETGKLFGDKSTDDIMDRIDFDKGPFTTNEIIEKCGAGGCYVYDSLPFSYHFFLNNPHSIESLYDVISAGGDTDTNGSIVGSMLGALNGTKIFPDGLVSGLDQVDLIRDTANRLADYLEVE